MRNRRLPWWRYAVGLGVLVAVLGLALVVSHATDASKASPPPARGVGKKWATTVQDLHPGKKPKPVGRLHAQAPKPERRFKPEIPHTEEQPLLELPSKAMNPSSSSPSSGQ
ncbi:hypothetical protein JCM13210_17400 [Thermaerobacter litoralis]